MKQVFPVHYSLPVHRLARKGKNLAFKPNYPGLYPGGLRLQSSMEVEMIIVQYLEIEHTSQPYLFVSSSSTVFQHIGI